MAKFKPIMKTSDKPPGQHYECTCGEVFYADPWQNVTEIPYAGRKLMIAKCPKCGMEDTP